MLLVLVAFAFVCFINDKTNDSNEESYNIITLLNVEINETILISNTWKPINLIDHTNLAITTISIIEK